MTDINVKIAAKGCDNTGITDQIATALHANLGHKIVAVVELASEARTEKRDGSENVTLSILTLEPAPDSMTADHLRELARAFHFERQLDTRAPGQLRLDDGSTEPKVADVLAAGNRHRPHPFLPDDAGKEQPICDVCGGIEASAVHSMQDALDVDDPDEPEQGDDEAPAAGTDPDLDTGDGVDEEDEPHAFFSEDGVDSCRLCGRHEDDGQGIHVADDQVVLDTDAEVVELPTTLANPFNPAS